MASLKRKAKKMKKAVSDGTQPLPDAKKQRKSKREGPKKIQKRQESKSLNRGKKKNMNRKKRKRKKKKLSLQGSIIHQKPDSKDRSNRTWSDDTEEEERGNLRGRKREKMLKGNVGASLEELPERDRGAPERKKKRAGKSRNSKRSFSERKQKTNSRAPSATSAESKPKAKLKMNANSKLSKKEKRRNKNKSRHSKKSKISKTNVSDSNNSISKNSTTSKHQIKDNDRSRDQSDSYEISLQNILSTSRSLQKQTNSLRGQSLELSRGVSVVQEVNISQEMDIVNTLQSQQHGSGKSSYRDLNNWTRKNEYVSILDNETQRQKMRMGLDIELHLPKSKISKIKKSSENKSESVVKDDSQEKSNMKESQRTGVLKKRKSRSRSNSQRNRKKKKKEKQNPNQQESVNRLFGILKDQENKILEENGSEEKQGEILLEKSQSKSFQSLEEGVKDSQERGNNLLEIVVEEEVKEKIKDYGWIFYPETECADIRYLSGDFSIFVYP